MRRGQAFKPAPCSHFYYLNALHGADLNAAHASNAFAGLKRVCFAVGAELKDFHRADIDTFFTSGAFFYVYIDHEHKISWTWGFFLINGSYHGHHDHTAVFCLKTVGLHRVAEYTGLLIGLDFFISYGKYSLALNAIHEQAHRDLVWFKLLSGLETHQSDSHLGLVGKHLPADPVWKERYEFFKVKYLHVSPSFMRRISVSCDQYHDFDHTLL